jgi:MoxR-like ATPase
VLIDEIDKADIDFPNDLLLVLDRLQFEIKEVKDSKYDALKGESQEDRKDFLPLIIITSNREKELPKAFLRRCLFYYIEFPNEDDLTKIIENHFKPHHHY